MWENCFGNIIVLSLDLIPYSPGVCDVVSEDKCFALILTKDELSKELAQSHCANMDGKLADIDDQDQFNALLAYGPGNDFQGNVWTAMRYVNKVRVSTPKLQYSLT